MKFANRPIKLLTIVLMVCFVLLAVSACDDTVAAAYIADIGGLKTSYSVGESVDYSAIYVNVVYSDGTTKKVFLSEGDVAHTDINTAESGDNVLEVTYAGLKATYNVKVKSSVNVTQLNTPSGLAVSGSLLSWGKVSNATKYAIYINGEYADTATTNSYEFDIVSGGNYTFKVKALSMNSSYTDSEFSEELTVTELIKLASPTNVTIKNCVLGWDKLETSDTTIKYIVKLGSGTVGEYTQNSLDLSTLNLGVGTYNFSIVATSSSSKTIQSEPSAAVTYTVTRLATPVCELGGTNNRTLSWAKVDGAIGYIVYNGQNVLTQLYSGDSLSTTLTFTEEGGYSISVKAVGSSGNASLALDSYVSSAKVFTITKLSSPSRFYLLNDIAYWDAVDGAQGYDIYYKNSSSENFSKLNASTISPSNTSFAISSVISDSDYYSFYLIVKGNGNTVMDSSASTTIGYRYVRALDTPELTKNGNLLSWTQVANAQYYEVHTQEGVCFSTEDNSNTAVRIKNLNLSYGIYYFKVRAIPVDDSGYTYSDFSNQTVEAYVVSTTIATPTLTKSGTVVSWNKVQYATAYNISISGDHVEMDDTGVILNSEFTKTVEGIVATSYDLSSLGAGEYDVSVYAVNEEPLVYHNSSVAKVNDVLCVETIGAPSDAEIAADGKITFTGNKYAATYTLEIFNPNNIKEYTASLTETAYDFVSFSPSDCTYTFKIVSTPAEAFDYYLDVSDSYSFAYKVIRVSSPEVSVSYSIEADTGAYRTVSWTASSGAESYIVTIDGTRVSEFESDVLSYNYSIADYFATEGLHTISVTACGNGRNTLTGTPGSANISVASALSVPTLPYVEYGILKWDIVIGADAYYIKLKDPNDPDCTPQIITVSTNQYDGLEEDVIYEASVAAVSISVNGSVKTETPTEYSDSFYFKISAFDGGSYNSTRDAVVWSADVNEVYTIYVSNGKDAFTYDYYVTEKGIKYFYIAEYYNELPAGNLTVNICKKGLNSYTADSKLKYVYNLTKLDTPEISLSNGAVVWNSVAKADYYSVTVDGTEYTISANALSGDMIPVGSGIITITAKSYSGLIDSKTATYTYNKLDIPDVEYDANKLYWDIENGITYSVINVFTRESITPTVNNGVAFVNIQTEISDYEVTATKSGCVKSNTWSLPEALDEDKALGINYGLGTADAPYIIETAIQFKAIENYTGKNFRVITDIDLGDNWVAFDLNSGNIIDFRNNTITYEITSTDNSTQYLGLFATNYGIIRNVIVSAVINVIRVDYTIEGEIITAHTLTASGSITSGGVCAVNRGSIYNSGVSGNIQGTVAVGGIAGSNYNYISSCYSAAYVTVYGVGLNNKSMAGGIVGSDSNGNISDCYTTFKDINKAIAEYKNESDDLSEIESKQWLIRAYSDSHYAFAGGIVGSASASSDNIVLLERNYTYANVYAYSSAKAAYAGGFAGETKGKVNVYDSLSTGYSKALSTASNSYAGGFIGSANGEAVTCYSMGSAIALATGESGTNYAGGFYGQKLGKAPTNSYYNVETAGTNVRTGNARLDYEKDIALTTSEMKTAAPFSAFSTDVWEIKDDGSSFPHLIGEKRYIVLDGEGGYSYTAAENALGSENNPVIISTDTANLVQVSNTDWFFEIGEGGLDFGGEYIKSIDKFTGTLDGKNRDFKNFVLTGDKYIGIIGINYGLVKNLIVSNFYSYIDSSAGDIYAGSIAGYNYGIIQDCIVNSGSLVLAGDTKIIDGILNISAKAGTVYLGGITGINIGSIIGTVASSSTDLDNNTMVANVAISATSSFGNTSYLGGIAGYNNRGYIINADARGLISGVGAWIKGGITSTSIKPVDTYGATIENISGCIFNEETTGCSSDDLYGTAY